MFKRLAKNMTHKEIDTIFLLLWCVDMTLVVTGIALVL